MPRPFTASAGNAPCDTPPGRMLTRAGDCGTEMSQGLGDAGVSGPWCLSAVHRKERKRLCTPWSSLLPSTRHNLTGIDPRHRRHHLLLLPSGPDKVRECLLRGGRSERPVSGAKPLRGNSAPRKADFGYRAPLAPRLAQPSFYTPEWFRFSRGKEGLSPAFRFAGLPPPLVLTPSRQHHKKCFSTDP